MENIQGTLLRIGTKHISFFSLGWMVLLTLTVFFQNISPWIMTPVVFIGIIAIPGFLLLINFNIRSSKILEQAIYSVGLGLFSVLFGGLLINWVLPYVGVREPLAVLPLVIFFDLLVLTLLGCLYFFNNDYVIEYQIQVPNKTNLFFSIFPFVFLVMSILGSIRLNNSGTGILTLLMLFGIALYVIAFVYFEKRIDSWVYVSALYIMSLSLLLMYSLRSYHILGWDINQEYQVFQTTLRHLVWKSSYYPGGEYNSCMSITILPTILQQLTHIPSEYVFKVTIQLFFAGLPVMIYSLARRYTQEIFAFLASFLFLSQTWFFEQMPALIRQEIAFIFYTLILLSLFDTQIEKRIRILLFYIFTVGLILSHYSTAYVWFTLLFGTILILMVSSYFFKELKNKFSLFKPSIFVIPVILICFWQISITGTGYALKKFINREDIDIPITSRIPVEMAHNEVNEILQEHPPSDKNKPNKSFVQGIIMRIFFINNNLNQDSVLKIAENKVTNRHRRESMQETFPEKKMEGYSLQTIDDRYYVNPKITKSLSILIGVLARVNKLLLINIFPIVGILGLYFAIHRRKSESSYDFIALNIAAYCFIVLMISIPWFQQYYNFTRLYLQMFITLSIFTIIGVLFVTQHIIRHQKLILTSMIVLIFCSLTGAMDQLTGGQTRITLNSAPAIHDTFYIHEAEIASAHWLYLNHGDNRVETDVIANLRLQSYGNFSADYFAIFPRTIEKNSYVYTIAHNIKKNHGYYLHQNNLLVYNYPLKFLNDNKNLIYNSGESRIYK